MKTNSGKILGAAAICLATAFTTRGQSTFTKIIKGPIVTDGGGSFGCAWGDYDNDGFPDLYVANSLDGGTNFLYHNNRDGTFTRITSLAPAKLTGQWHGCSWADFNDDGRLDLIAIRTEDDAVQAYLFRNDGDNAFTQMPVSTFGGVIHDGGGHCQAALWADYDNDGFLDVFFNRWGNDWLYHNNGDGTLKLTSLIAGNDGDQGFAAAWADYDNDGLPDLVVTVTSDPPSRRLYHNLGGGNFQQVTTGDLVTDGGGSFGCAWADYDNDGFLDLLVVKSDSDGTNLLYRNNGNGTFTRVSSAIAGSIVSDSGGYTICTWGDYDNDGWIDCFVSTTSSLSGNVTGNALYHNNGDGSFTRVADGGPAGEVANSVGCAWADYDNDGFLDLFVANGGIVQAENNSLYHNDGNGNSWLKVKCVGTVSNHSAIGAKVRVKATIRGKTIWQLREINSGNGFCQSPLEAHFGLGDATNATTLRIEWPSGTVQEFQNITARQLLTITEPPRLQALHFTPDGSFQLSLAGAVGSAYDIQGSSDLFHWTHLTSVTNVSRIATLTDTTTGGTLRRFYRALTH